jgi:hypothetical protein
VQFDTTDRFCTDYVNFVVADFEGTYHAILGHPAITKFMVVPHYRYLVLNMPTERESSLSEAMYSLPIPVKWITFT